jgi:hypothetical protein
MVEKSYIIENECKKEKKEHLGNGKQLENIFKS